MRQLQVVDDVHQLAMNQRNDKSVNPVPVDYMDSTPVGKTGCVDFVYKVNADHEMGGALFSPQNDPDIPQWAKFFGLNRRIKYLSLDTCGRDEFDVKWTLANGLQINTSNQIHLPDGMWQTDPNDPPKWEDSGFNVLKLIDPCGWNEFMFRCSTDGVKTWNVDALSCNGTPYTNLPANNRGIALKPTNWKAMRAHFQEQAEVMGAPAYTIKRYQKCQLVMSDQPIPWGWF